MDYLKIATIANRCEVKRQQIAEHYRMIGANMQFTDETKNVFYAVINDMKKELEGFENRLKKLIQ